MLANRADIYNLGEVLGGMDEAFSLSYRKQPDIKPSISPSCITRPERPVLIC